jgi:Phage derived protein Gp49-like (DUF891)
MRRGRRDWSESIQSSDQTLETTRRKTPRVKPAHGAPPTFPGFPLEAHVSAILPSMVAAKKKRREASPGHPAIARVLFYIDKKGRMVLLHGFIKKTQKTPDDDLLSLA